MGLTDAAREARAETASPTLIAAGEPIERPIGAAGPSSRRFPFGHEPLQTGDAADPSKHDTDPMELRPDSFPESPWAKPYPTTEPPPPYPTTEPPPPYPTTEPPPSWATPIYAAESPPESDGVASADRLSSPPLGDLSEVTEVPPEPDPSRARRADRADLAERRARRRERFAVISVFLLLNATGWILTLLRAPLPVLTAHHWPGRLDRIVVDEPATARPAPSTSSTSDASGAPPAASDRRCRPSPAPSRKAPRRNRDLVDPWAR